MADTISVAHRSWNMSRIRGRDTTPERRVRSALHRLGYRFRITPRSLPGRPDIVLPRFRAILFVHGCYWHRHSRCKLAYEPKSNRAFWQAKFAANVERDRRIRRDLKRQGWVVLTIWECQTKVEGRLMRTLTRVLDVVQHV